MRTDTSIQTISLDHALRSHLVGAGVPAIPVIPTRDGITWLVHPQGVVDLSPFREGACVGEPAPAQLHEAGRALARFHIAGAEFAHPAAGQRLREDHSSLLHPVLRDLCDLAVTTEQRAALDDLERQVRRVCGPLDEGLYDELTDTVVHGDFHPGNVFFQGSKVVAVFDLDWAHRGASLRDIGDGLMFFCATRPGSLDPDDIRSLDQRWTLDAQRCRCFTRGYTTERPLPAGTEHLGQIMLSRWLQCRIRGSRKVDPEERISFATTGIEEQAVVLQEELAACLSRDAHLPAG